MDVFDEFIEEIVSLNPYEIESVRRFEEMKKILAFKINRNKDLEDDEKKFLIERLNQVTVDSFSGYLHDSPEEVFGEFVKQVNDRSLMNTDEFIFYRYPVSKLLQVGKYAEEYVKLFDVQGIRAVLIDLLKMALGNKMGRKTARTRLNECLDAGVITNEEYQNLSDIISKAGF